MSPRVPVLPLGYLCVKFLSNRLIQILSSDENSYNETTRDYLSDVTYEVLQELLENILNSTTLDAATRFSCLEVLLRNDIKKLETGMFPHSYYEKILKVIISNGRGLQKVNLKGVWARDHPALLAELVSSLNNLKVLIIPHMANDAVLKCISSCKNLNVLDISGEAYFTPEGLLYLKNENLQILDIGYYGKKEVCEGSSDDTELISNVITNLPNLKSLRTYGFTGSSLLFLHNSKTSNVTQLNYLHDIRTTNEIIEAIYELCPFLESIHLDSPEEGVILKLLNLKRLSSLRLNKASNAELAEYLLNNGSNIEILKIFHNKTERLDFSNIATGAPRIHTIEFDSMHLTFYRQDVCFNYLQDIELSNCDISNECLKRIFLNSPILKKIIVGSIVRLTDEDIGEICIECELEYLEILWFCASNFISIMAVELLIACCPNLKVLGRLDMWMMIDSEEIERLQSAIEESNINLCINPLPV